MTQPSPAPARPTATEPTHLEYQQVDRAGREPVWGWGLLSVVSAVVGFLVAQVVVATAFSVVLALMGNDADEVTDLLTDLDDPHPVTLALLLSAISASIPAIMLAHRLITGLSPRWLLSVAGRIRWGWLAVTMGIALVTLVVNIVLGTVLPISGGTGTETDVQGLTSTAVRFLLVVAFLVPFQAAAEEFVFRGLMMQALGSITARLWVSRVVSVVVPAFVFACFHGLGQSLPIFLDRFSFGVVAGVLAIVTGGIEAGIGYHVVNNWLAFTVAILVDDLGGSLDPQGGNGWNIVVTLASSCVFLGLTFGASRLMHLQTTVDRTVLAPSAARV